MRDHPAERRLKSTDVGEATLPGQDHAIRRERVPDVE